ncbi:glutathione S-transferase family protein [Paracoccaceae bacterium GXU_MW_L88]
MLTLYSMPSSGNSYKIRLLLAKLGQDYRHVACEAGSAAWEDAKPLSPLGKLPFMQLDDGRVLAESNAILLYLAEGTRFLPGDRYARAKVHEWMFFEQNRHEPVIAVRASLNFYPDLRATAKPERLAELLEAGQTILVLMERQLQETPYLAGDTITVADLALYAYTHTAEERGGYDLSGMPALKDWLARVAADEGHIALDDIPA